MFFAQFWQTLNIIFVLNSHVKEKNLIAMIVTCPNCNCQFKLDIALLGENGRDVRCSVCKETWYQELDEELLKKFHEEQAVEEFESVIENVAADIDEKFEEIKERVEVEQELSVSKFVKDSRDVKLSYAIAACFFLCIFTYLLLNNQAIINNNPAMNGFYSLFGISVPVPGKGLIFDQIAAEDNGETLRVAGKITNLMSEPNNIPFLKATLTDHEDNPIKEWYVRPPKEYLEPEETAEFDFLYYKEDEEQALDNSNIHLRFALLSEIAAPRIGEEDGGSSQAHHQDDSNHPNAHEADEVSHPHASSQPHPELSRENHEDSRSPDPHH